MRLLDESEPIEMLVTDVVMPGMKGTELAAEIRRRIPSLPVLFMSGYNEHALSPSDNIVTKPFTPEMLLQRVRQILDHR